MITQYGFNKKLRWLSSTATFCFS